ncbi:MAG: ribonuclease HI family protein [Actinobacteria bacterium]|nr:ribonuclease HI family protein [Actinomycetota bacterium]
MRLIVHCDGASRGNPGPAAAGVVALTERGAIVGRLAVHLGEMTNNQAEYHAVLAAVQLAGLLRADVIDCRLDSELTVRQLNGDWKLRDPELRVLAGRVRAALAPEARAIFTHVPRAHNALADRLANWALDRSQPSEGASPPPV